MYVDGFLWSQGESNANFLNETVGTLSPLYFLHNSFHKLCKSIGWLNAQKLGRGKAWIGWGRFGGSG